MKQIIIHKQFVKHIRKLSPSIQRAFQSRRDLFLKDEFHSQLHVHALSGKYKGYKSFNVNADVRVVFKEIDTDTYLFLEIGSHSELYL